MHLAIELLGVLIFAASESCLQPCQSPRAIEPEERETNLDERQGYGSLS